MSIILYLPGFTAGVAVEDCPKVNEGVEAGVEVPKPPPNDIFVIYYDRKIN